MSDEPRSGSAWRCKYHPDAEVDDVSFSCGDVLTATDRRPSSAPCASPTKTATNPHGLGQGSEMPPKPESEISPVGGSAPSSSAVPSDMGRAVSWLQKWVYSGDDGPNLNTLLAELLADVRRETVEACANVASIPVLRDEPHRIVRNISNLATMSAETIAKLAEKKP